MKFCPDCHVNVGGEERNCPLCGADLEPQDSPQVDERLYPDFSAREKHQERFPFPARILAFISGVAIIACVVIDIILNRRLSWSLYVVGGILTAWITIAMPILRNPNINYMLLCDLCSISALLVLVDAMNGWTRWSVTIVLPCFYISISIAVVVLALVFHDFWREYILSLTAICALGLVPLLTLITGQATVPGFCLAAVFFAAILLAAVFFFANGKLFSEWKRRMNL